MNQNQRLAAALRLIRSPVPGGKVKWFVSGLDVDMGPYDSKGEAEEARRGVQRFLRNEHRRHFVTTTKGKRR